MIRLRVFIVVFAVILLTPDGGAHDIITTNLTYCRDVSRIFASRCLACHGPNDSIPLSSYKEARPWAVGIKEQVLSRQMPPWGAVKGFGSFSPDRGLTEEEMLIIAAWVVGGAPEGDPRTLPATVPHSAKPQLIALRDGPLVDRSQRLTEDTLVAGIRPDVSLAVASARIVASLPDGRKWPLIWLFHYDPKWKQVFRFRESLLLPAGSVVASDVPLRFALETK